MSEHLIAPASSGRAKCRGCGQRIATGAMRFGERLPNPFAEGEMTHWFHLECVAYKRPEPLLETLGERPDAVDDAPRLMDLARPGISHRRLPRIDGAERAATGRAECRSCHAPIEKGRWRIPLVYYEEGRFAPAGFIHTRCSLEYFGTTDILERLRHFAPDLGTGDLAELRAELELASTNRPPPHSPRTDR